MEDPLLKPAEVAQILQVSRAKAYELLKRGEMPVIRIGTLVRVRRSDLESYILERRNGNQSTDLVKI
jgi:excisionase family DNA binding protein